VKGKEKKDGGLVAFLQKNNVWIRFTQHKLSDRKPRWGGKTALLPYEKVQYSLRMERENYHPWSKGAGMANGKGEKKGGTLTPNP